MTDGNGFCDVWPSSAGRLVCLFFARVLVFPVVTSGAVRLWLFADFWSASLCCNGGKDGELPIR